MSLLLTCGVHSIDVVKRVKIRMEASKKQDKLNGRRDRIVCGSCMRLSVQLRADPPLLIPECYRPNVEGRPLSHPAIPS